MAALLAGAATLAKPSFTVAAVPALGLWRVLARWLPRAVDTRAARAPIAFPLCVALARWPASRRDGPLMLAWLVFVIAAAYGYLLAEAEPNTDDGNGLWSGQVALFVLFAESILFLRSRGFHGSPPTRRWRRACALVFALHLACGLAWYGAEVLQPHAWWFPFQPSDQ